MKTVQLFPLILVLAIHAWAQTASAPVWTMQESGTTAGLRGIFSVDGAVAWASGTEGTVLRTVDGGAHWMRCATPDGDKDGATLDFRGVQAWDEKTAIVMASGPGDKSRLYKTEDGCATWKQNLSNSSSTGFWDVVQFVHSDFGFAIAGPQTGVLVGDPVANRFETYAMVLGHGWFLDSAGCESVPGESAFAASNSSAFVFGNLRYLQGTGGKQGAFVLISPLLSSGTSSGDCKRVKVPIGSGTESSGVFSIYFRTLKAGVAVGGDYSRPEIYSATAAYSTDGGDHWTASATPPHGYRSAVQWSESLKLWITVGTNGSDISRDDGKTWQPLDNGNWNALSLPFIVGPGGRIAKLNAAALPKP